MHQPFQTLHVGSFLHGYGKCIQSGEEAFSHDALLPSGRHQMIDGRTDMMEAEPVIFIYRPRRPSSQSEIKNTAAVVFSRGFFKLLGKLEEGVDQK